MRSKMRITKTEKWKKFCENSKTKPLMVAVLWEDAETDSGWDTHDSKEATAPIVLTVGFLVKESRGAIVVASTVDSDISNNSRILIPSRMIKSMEIIHDVTSKVL